MFLKILQKIGRKSKSDRGASEMITFLIVVPILLAFVASIIDISIYFSNRSQITAVARDAARTVAIMGGNGTASTATVIEKSYGMNRAEACLSSSFFPGFKEAIKTTSTPIECNALKNIQSNTGLVSVNFAPTSASDTTQYGVKCSPEKASSIGQRTECSITYNYVGLPLSPISWIKTPDGNGLLGKNTTIASSESEVNLSDVPLQVR